MKALLFQPAYQFRFIKRNRKLLRDTSLELGIGLHKISRQASSDLRRWRDRREQKKIAEETGDHQKPDCAKQQCN